MGRRAKAATIFVLSLLALQLCARELPTDATFDDLLTTSRTLSSKDDFAKVEEQLWSKYQAAMASNIDHVNDIDTRQIAYGDKVMRYSLEQIGTPGPKGYPLYIALHGGGAAGPWVNDSQWEHMKVYYRDSVENGIYVAARGVTDTWNLHFVDESYALYDHLITDLIATGNVDPNRVYITGFSAGGDGVYQVGPRMPDRFAAANMSAGHSNWIRFDNLYNLPFLLQVGSRDAAYSRHRNAPENALQLDKLALERGGYKHEMFLHSNGSHNSWRDNDNSGRMQTVITNLADWLNGASPVTAQANTNAIHWMDSYTRNPLPSELYWDFEVNAKRDYIPGALFVSTANQAKLVAPKNLYYWLSVLDGDQSKANLLHAQIIASENRIKLSGLERMNHLKLLLRPEMISFDHPVTIELDGKEMSVTLASDVRVMTRTLLERGDRNYMFCAEIELFKRDGVWVAIQ